MRMMSFMGLAIGLMLGLLVTVQAQLQPGFYHHSCPQAEDMILGYIMENIPHEPSLAPTLLRMQFHDCFVRGCDASVLINSTKKHQAEKAATPNLTLRGFDFIDRLKSLVEKECPGVVSCADIIALAARDAVGVIGGPFWNVLTGRRDGLISRKKEALNNIPAPTFNFSALVKSFAKKGLDVKDLIWLSGSHTIGVAHCLSFNSRLYNFTGKGYGQDPSLDPLYAATLKTLCKNPQDNTTIVAMDPGSPLTFDLGYYIGVLERRGLFTSDAALITNGFSKSELLTVVHSPPQVFFELFAASMEKMIKVEVKTGTEGEIRKNCAVVNA